MKLSLLRSEGERAMRSTAMLFGLAFVATLASAESPKPAKAPSIEPLALHALLAGEKSPQVIDVRTSEEYAAGHIPGALHIPFDEIAERIVEIDTPNGVALYCMVGPRARKGEAALRKSGYTEVLHIQGGLSAWQESGLPVERGR